MVNTSTTVRYELYYYTTRMIKTRRKGIQLMRPMMPPELQQREVTQPIPLHNDIPQGNVPPADRELSARIRAWIIASDPVRISADGMTIGRIDIMELVSHFPELIFNPEPLRVIIEDNAFYTVLALIARARQVTTQQ